MRKTYLLMLAASFSLAGPAFAQTGPVATACQDDIARYCPEIDHIGGAVRLCLDEHISNVSLDCREALETTGPRNRRLDRDGRGRQGVMGLRQIVGTVEALGYTDVTEIDLEGGHYEIEATGPEGAAVELYVDAVTGKVLRVKPDDD